MKFQIPIKILLALLIFAAVAADSGAQTESPAPAPAAEQPMAPVMAEDDRLPFMQAEQKTEMQEPGSGGLILRTLASMVLIVGLIFLAAWGLKKYGFAGLRPDQNDRTPDLSIVSTVNLGNNRSISTIRFGDRLLLVGSTAQSFTLLAEDFEASKSSDAAPAARIPRSVAEMLASGEPDFAEKNNFGEEFERARFRLDHLDEEGGKI